MSKMSLLSRPQILHVGLTIVLLNLCLFDCNIYVPVSIRHLVIPFLISVTVDSRVLHTKWVFPIDNESMFKYFNVDFSLYSDSEERTEHFLSEWASRLGQF